MDKYVGFERLFDDGEFTLLEAHSGEGLAAAYGRVCGKLAFAAEHSGAADAALAAKMADAAEKALRTGAPLALIVGAGGVKLGERLEGGADGLAAYSGVFAALTRLRGVVPVLCAAGGGLRGLRAALPSFCDFALDGDDDGVYDDLRALIGFLPSNNLETGGEVSLPRLESGVLSAFADIADGRAAFEVGADEGGSGLVTAFGYAGRANVGFAEFSGALNIANLEKFVRFARLCDNFNVPIVTIWNAGGVRSTEADLGTDSRFDGAFGVAARAFYAVGAPKLHVVAADCFGAANALFAGADITVALETARFGAFSPDASSKVFGEDAPLDGGRWRDLAADGVVSAERLADFAARALFMLSSKRVG